MRNSVGFPKTLFYDFIVTETDPEWRHSAVVDTMLPHPYVQSFHDSFQGLSVIVGPLYAQSTCSMSFSQSSKTIRIIINFPEHQYQPQLPASVASQLEMRPKKLHLRVRVPQGIYWGHSEIADIGPYTMVRMFHMRDVSADNTHIKVGANGERTLPAVAPGRMHIYVNSNEVLSPYQEIDL